MIRWSCQRLHGCVPVAPSSTPSDVRELVQLRAPLAHLRGASAKRLAAAGAHLDLGGDQLADEVLLERRALRGSLQLLEAVASARASPGRGSRTPPRRRRVKSSPRRNASQRASAAARRSAASARRPSRRSLSVERRQQALGDARPAPALDRALRARSPSARRSSAGSASSARELVAQVGGVAVREARRARARSGGYSASSPAATSARPEWRATSGGQPAAAASAATMPNASGKIDGTTATSHEREQRARGGGARARR